MENHIDPKKYLTKLEEDRGSVYAVIVETAAKLVAMHGVVRSATAKEKISEVVVNGHWKIIEQTLNVLVTLADLREHVDEIQHDAGIVAVGLGAEAKKATATFAQALHAMRNGPSGGNGQYRNPIN